MLLRQFRLSNNLLTHITENTDFSWEKPRKLQSPKANFEGCDQRDLEAKKRENMNNASSYFKFNGRPSIIHRSLI